MRINRVGLAVATVAASLAALGGAALADTGTVANIVDGPFGPGVVATAGTTAQPGGPANPLGLVTYYVYGGGSQLSPSAATAALDASPTPGITGSLGITAPDTTASPDITTCGNFPVNDPLGGKVVEIYVIVSCTKPSAVTNVHLTLWQRQDPNGSGGWQDAADRYPAGGNTPYSSQMYNPGCKGNWQMHTQAQLDVVTPDGSGPEDANSDNETCS